MMAEAVRSPSGEPHHHHEAGGDDHNKHEGMASLGVGSTDRNIEYILLAEFDIDKGSTLRHQIPGPIPSYPEEYHYSLNILYLFIFIFNFF